MAVTSSLPRLKEDLHELGYQNLTLKQDSISGIVYGVDVSSAPKSVPEDGGPFKTLDDPDALIPTEIQDAVTQHDATVTVLGHGPDRLHLYIEPSTDT